MGKKTNKIMVKYYCIIFKSKCALWVNETTGKLFKTCFLCAALVKKGPLRSLCHTLKR